VLSLIAKGHTNREAAARLFISEATVKTHLPHIYSKLGVKDRAAAVAAAFERGLLTPGRR
jgi:DNA-binding NarL/FixJ family response regulator